MSVGWLWKPKHDPAAHILLDQLRRESAAEQQKIRAWYEARDEAALGHVNLYDPVVGWLNMVQALRVAVYHDALSLPRHRPIGNRVAKHYFIGTFCIALSDCLPMEARGILGLAIGYGAYIAEVVRAGIQSVDRGQREAASSLGMSHHQAMRYVILPQATRLALPPRGNDFVALLKDSSLVSVLAVSELTHEARLDISRTFNALEVWNIVALT